MKQTVGNFRSWLNLTQTVAKLIGMKEIVKRKIKY